jgi:hypothetical protein
MVTATCRWGWVWSKGRMILTRENRKTQRNTCPSATFGTTNLTWTDLGSNQVLRGNRPVTNLLTHRTARILKRKITQSYWKVRFAPCSERSPVVINNQLKWGSKCCLYILWAICRIFSVQSGGRWSNHWGFEGLIIPDWEFVWVPKQTL